MRFHVVTLFPELFESVLSGALLGKAVGKELVSVGFTDPRDFTSDKHRTVDDTPFGGGSGMVLKPEPMVAAIEAADAHGRSHRVLLSPQGKPLNQDILRQLAQKESVTLVCGRYEGFDERIIPFVDEEISLGDFVLNGGEVAAMAIIDGVSRLVPGVIGNPESLETESHSAGLLEYPQYTRPRVFRDMAVPDTLLSGDHAKIHRWRRLAMLKRTRDRRPELVGSLGQEDQHLLAAAGEPVTHAQRQAAAAARTYVALLHHPVYDRSGEVVTTALTNLDLHDIARSCRSFALAGYFIVTPLSSQQELARRILSHWRNGHGARVHDKRREALGLVDVCGDLDELMDEVTLREGVKPLLVATSARGGPDRTTPAQLMDTMLGQERPAILMLGTGWGLTEEVMDRADETLGPILGPTDYNHLSVRSAAAILLDRCFGMRD